MSNVTVFSRPDISVKEKIPETLYVSTSVNNYNSIIQGRQTRSYFPDSLSEVVSNSNSVINIKLNESGDDFIDPATAKIFFDAKINKVADTDIGMFQDGVCWFERCELWIGGSMLEEIVHPHELINSLTYFSVSKDWLTSKEAEDMNFWRYAPVHSNRVDSMAFNVAGMDTLNTISANQHLLLHGIPVFEKENEAFNYKTFAIPLSTIFGLFRVSQFLHSGILKGIEIKLYINSYQNACLELEDQSAAAVDVVAGMLRNRYRLETTNTTDSTTRTFTIKNLKVSVDLMSLHPSYVQSLKTLASSSTGFVIMLDSWLYSSEVITQDPASVTVLRSVSSLKDIWCLLRRNSLDYMDSAHESSDHDLVKYRVSLGSKSLTQHDITTLEEAYNEVLKSLNVVGNINHQPIVNSELYEAQMFVLAQNVELVSVQGNASSVSTRMNNNNIRIDLEITPEVDPFILYNRTVAQANYKCLLQVFLHHDISIFVRNNAIEIIK
jgi:hypothetical protein